MTNTRTPVSTLKETMNSIPRLACIYFAALLTPFNAGSAIITFDDIPTAWNGSFYEAQMPNGYMGLQWSNFRVFDVVNFQFISGYQNGMVSPSNAVYNAYGDPALVSDGAFNLNSAYMTGAWNDGLHVEVQGYVGSTLIYDNTYIVDTTAPTLINFNYLGITSVKFISSGGVLHSGYWPGSGTQFVMDNLTITAVPEPSFLALAGLGTVVVLLYRRRR